MSFLKKKELKYTYTTRYYKYIHEKLQKVKRRLNSILFNSFSSNVIDKCLFAKYRNEFNGFNFCFTIEYLIFLFNDLIDKENTYKMILDELDNFLTNKEFESGGKYNLENPYSQTTKLYPYLQKPIRDVVKRLNTILKANFNEKLIRESLYAKYHYSYHGFIYSLSLDFLIQLFQVFNNELDVKNLLLPLMENFLKEKDRINIID